MFTEYIQSNVNRFNYYQLLSDFLNIYLFFVIERFSTWLISHIRSSIPRIDDINVCVFLFNTRFILIFLFIFVVIGYVIIVGITFIVYEELHI